MFCSECGAAGAGKFCSACGHALIASPPPIDWESSIEHSVIVKVPEVAEQIRQAEVRASKRLQGDAVIDLVDKLAAPLTMGISSRLTAKVLTPIASALGIRTKKAHCQSFALPPGRAMARLLIGMADRGYKLTSVEQQPASCTLTADIPADLCSLVGTLRIELTRTAMGVNLSVEAVIEGQWYDWGKCNRRIGELLQSIRSAA